MLKLTIAAVLAAGFSCGVSAQTLPVPPGPGSLLPFLPAGILPSVPIIPVIGILPPLPVISNLGTSPIAGTVSSVVGLLPSLPPASATGTLGAAPAP